ncbi:MAG: ABC transporter ATP-binding protein [Thermoplasmatota archaeon]
MGDAAVDLQGVARSFGDIRAVDGLDLTVEEGSVFGLLGPNGAGKTTTLHLMLGLLRPDAGSLRVLGRDVATDAPAVRMRCGVLLEHDGLYERLNAHRNLSYFGAQYGLEGQVLERRIEDALDRAGLAGRGGDLVATYSRGMKRRLAVARAFLHRPELVILDEPTSGLDPQKAVELRAFIREQVEDGVTVLLSSHNLREAEQMCDQVAILRDGRKLLQGPPGRLVDAPPVLDVSATDVADAQLSRLRRRKAVQEVERTPRGIRVTLRAEADAPVVVKALASMDVAVAEVRLDKPDLERSFLEALET